MSGQNVARAIKGRLSRGSASHAVIAALKALSGRAVRNVTHEPAHD